MHKNRHTCNLNNSDPSASLIGRLGPFWSRSVRLVCLRNAESMLDSRGAEVKVLGFRGGGGFLLQDGGYGRHIH